MKKTATAWIIGTGPSLRGVDISKLKNEHTITFNRAYVAFDDWGFDPTYYLSIDSNDLRSMYKDINKLIKESSIKYFFLSPCEDNVRHSSEHFQDEEKPDKMFVEKDNVYFIHKGATSIKACSLDYERRIFYTRHHPNAGFLAVKLFYALGYNEVAFVGCDARYKDDEESNKYITKVGGEYVSHKDYDLNHFRDDYFGKGTRFGKPNQDEIISLWSSAAKEIESLDNFRVYSCTEGSNLNEFYKYIPFEDFLRGKKMSRVLVTGGSGFLGQRLKKYQDNWIYVSSKECDLTNNKKVRELFMDVQPDSIVHLAARVGGIKDNIENQADFFHINTMMNTNVIHQAHMSNIDRVLSCLSTCAFPNTVDDYPFTEEQMFQGPPANSNFSYGMTKRMLQVSSMAYRKQYKRNYSTFCPSNLYGPGDHFNSEKSHFVPALITKVSTLSDGDTLKLWGTGKPLRQQLYVDDLCEIIPILLELHNSDTPLIVAPSENLSISAMTKILLKTINKKLDVEYNLKLDGQFRKDGGNKKLLELIGNYNFTPFSKGIESTYKWYMENK